MISQFFYGEKAEKYFYESCALKPICGVSPPPHSSTFSEAEKVSFYWGGMPPQTPMLLLRGPQSTNSTSQIKDLESHWESRQKPSGGSAPPEPCTMSQWATLYAVQSKIELLYTSLLLLNRKKSQDFFRRGEAAKIVRAVVLTAANRFELASTMAPAEGCSFINASPLFFTLVPSQKWVGIPLNQLQRKLSNYAPLKHNVDLNFC